jgi:hypothetical protein
VRSLRAVAVSNSRSALDQTSRAGSANRPSCSVWYLRHDDKVSDGSPNGPALRPILGLARGVAPPCALGSSQSRPRRGVWRARGAAPPCVPGSSENRQWRGVGSRLLRFLVILILESRPRQSAPSGWGHCLTRYRRARSLASGSCHRQGMGVSLNACLNPMHRRASAWEGPGGMWPCPRCRAGPRSPSPARPMTLREDADPAFGEIPGRARSDWSPFSA